MYNPQIRAESQVLRPISKCQAEARRLRAKGVPPGKSLCPTEIKHEKNPHTQTQETCSGLLSQVFLPSGSCLCLYPKSFLELEAPLLPTARICEVNLSPVVLLLKRRQIAEPGECHFLDQPGEHPPPRSCCLTSRLQYSLPAQPSFLTSSRSPDAGPGRSGLPGSPG